MVLGIDPGLARTGWAVITRDEKNRISLVQSDVIIADSAANLHQKLVRIFIEVKKIVSYCGEYGGVEVAIENTYVNVNYESSLKLAQARAAAIVACAKYRLFEYPAKTIKKTIAGNGNATKPQVAQLATSAIQSFPFNKACYDQTDAIAIALCHAYHIGWR